MSKGRTRTERRLVVTCTNYRYLTSDDMCERLKRMHQEVVHSRREIEKLRKHVEMLGNCRGPKGAKSLMDAENTPLRRRTNANKK